MIIKRSEIAHRILVLNGGRAYEFTFLNTQSPQTGIIITGRTHIPPELTSDNDRIFIDADGYKMGFLIDSKLYSILINQHYEDILNYTIEAKTVIQDSKGFLDIMSDGTMFYLEEETNNNLGET